MADSSGARISRAQIVLENPLSGRKSETIAGDQGQFQFENVPYGAYVVRVSAAGFKSSATDLNVRSNVPVRVSVKLEISTNKVDLTVEMPDVLGHETPRTETIIDERDIKLTPSVVRRDQLQALVSTTPGWNTENDGLMHIRGVDDGTLYVVGGVPTPDRVDGLFAGSFNTDAITSLDIITGNIPAEFGDRSGAVVVVQPKSGLATPLNGTLALGAGSFDSGDVSTTLGGGTKEWGSSLLVRDISPTGSLTRWIRAISTIEAGMFHSTFALTGTLPNKTFFVWRELCKARILTCLIMRISKQPVSASARRCGTTMSPSHGSTAGLPTR